MGKVDVPYLSRTPSWPQSTDDSAAIYQAQVPIHHAALSDQFVPDEMLTSYRIGCSNLSSTCTGEAQPKAYDSE